MTEQPLPRCDFITVLLTVDFTILSISLHASSYRRRLLLPPLVSRWLVCYYSVASSTLQRTPLKEYSDAFLVTRPPRQLQWSIAS